MTNHQGYAVFWDDTDTLTGRERKLHRYFNTLHGAQCFASTLKDAKVTERTLLSDDQVDAAQRSFVQKLNRDELTRLMLHYGFTIRAKDFPNWRPTQRVTGSIPGVWEFVEIIATDGLLGMFLNDRQEPLIGHTHMFSERDNIKPLFSIQKDNTKPKVKKERKKSARQKLIDSL